MVYMAIEVHDMLSPPCVIWSAAMQPCNTSANQRLHNTQKTFQGCTHIIRTCGSCASGSRGIIDVISTATTALECMIKPVTNFVGDQVHRCSKDRDMAIHFGCAFPDIMSVHLNLGRSYLFSVAINLLSEIVEPYFTLRMRWIFARLIQRPTRSY